MKNKHTLYFFVLFVFAVVASVIACLFADEVVITIISTVSTMVGIIGLLISFRLDRNISEASFLFDLNKTFRGSNEVQRIAVKLEKFFLGEEVSITEVDRHDIVSYLTFFEMLANLYERGVISINSFDSLFAYDFFIAVNNKEVQKIEINDYLNYYVKLMKLKTDWEKYRKRKKLPIPLTENK